MGLKKARTDPATQASYPDAYWAIIGADGNLTGNYVAAQVAIYASQDAAVSGAQPVKIMPVPFTPDDLAALLVLDNTPRTFRDICVAAMYLMLKRHSELQGATDA